MGIPDEDVARVRAETDIVSLIGEHAALKRVGQRWQGLCPFHGEKTPSFSVNAEEGFYYCFGCLAKGDAISFVRATEHLDFVDAVRRLADRAGITIREDAGSGRDSQRRKVFLDVMERATEWYHQRLLTSPDAGQARDYLRSRGYDGEVVRRFRLGWAPDDWDALCRGLGLSEELAVGRRPRVRQPPPSAAGRLPGPRPLPHLRSLRSSGGPRGPGAARELRPGQVQELQRDADLLQAKDAVRPQLGQAGHHRLRRGGGLRGVHRRHRAVRCRCASAPWPPAGRPWPRST